MAHFNADFLDFFKELSANNTKDWMDIHRKRYEQEVKEPFKKFVSLVLNRFSEIDKNFNEVEASDCIFRMNRDVRFAKDKSPYKLMSSAVISTGGKKGKELNGVYLELGPEHVRVYGGIYEIDKEDLMYLREGIANSLDEFETLIASKDFREMYGVIRGEKNKKVPKELKDAAQKQELVLNKQFYFYTEFSAETVLNSDLDQLVLDCYLVARPLEMYFSKLLKNA